MNDLPIGAAESADHVDTARIVYQAMTKALRTNIDKLNQGDLGDKDLMSMLKLHVTALARVMEAEADLAKYETDRTGLSSAALDLDSARREIGGRLARLASARGY